MAKILPMPEGKIELDSPFAKQIGFVSEGFDKDCYLWGCPEYNGIYLSLIISKKKGYFRRLMQNIEKYGYTFRIPTPSDRMIEIGKKQGWRMGHVWENGDRVFILTNDKNGAEITTFKDIVEGEPELSATTKKELSKIATETKKGMQELGQLLEKTTTARWNQERAPLKQALQEYNKNQDKKRLFDSLYDTINKRAVGHYWKNLAHNTGLTKAKLFSALKRKNANPTFDTLQKIFKELDIKMTVVLKEETEK